MEYMTAESTQDLFEYMARKIDRGTTWEQLANKLNERGIFIHHNKIIVLWNKLYHDSVKNRLGEEIFYAFGQYTRAVDAAFLSDSEMHEKLIKRLDMFVEAAPREHYNLDELTPKLEFLRNLINEVFE